MHRIHFVNETRYQQKKRVLQYKVSNISCLSSMINPYNIIFVMHFCIQIINHREITKIRMYQTYKKKDDGD